MLNSPGLQFAPVWFMLLIEIPRRVSVWNSLSRIPSFERYLSQNKKTNSNIELFVIWTHVPCIYHISTLHVSQSKSQWLCLFSNFQRILNNLLEKTKVTAKKRRLTVSLFRPQKLTGKSRRPQLWGNKRMLWPPYSPPGSSTDNTVSPGPGTLLSSLSNCLQL